VRSLVSHSLVTPRYLDSEVMGHDLVASEAAAIHAALRDGPDLVIAESRLQPGSGSSAMEEIIR